MPFKKLKNALVVNCKTVRNSATYMGTSSTGNYYLGPTYPLHAGFAVIYFVHVCSEFIDIAAALNDHLIFLENG